MVFVEYFNEVLTHKEQVYATIFIVKYNKLLSTKIFQNKSTRAFILLVEEEEEAEALTAKAVQVETTSRSQEDSALLITSLAKDVGYLWGI